jgi:hypothetical protein
MTWAGSAPPHPRYEHALTGIARAIMRRDPSIDGVMLSPTTAWVIRADIVVRYRLSAETKTAVARYVEGGAFEPGAYRLLPPYGTPVEATAAILVELRRADLAPMRRPPRAPEKS